MDSKNIQNKIEIPILGEIIRTETLSNKELKLWMKNASLSSIFNASILDERIDKINFATFIKASRKMGRDFGRKIDKKLNNSILKEGEKNGY